MLTASVVVCTYKPDDGLLPTIEALLAQASPGGRLELVIVAYDPAPSFARVRKMVDSLKNAKIVEDPGTGLSLARNLGVHHSTGDLVAFVDDTAIAEPGWLEAVTRAFEANGCDALGGEIAPEWEGELPRWFDPLFEVSIGAKRAMARGLMAFPETPFGANMAFRREVFTTYGMFDTRLGRVPGSQLSNEEVELCYRIYAGGGTIFFEPSARVRHRVPRSRVNLRYARRRAYWQGVSRIRMYRVMGRPPPPLAETTLALLKHSVDGLHNLLDPRRRARAEYIALSRIGELVEDFRPGQGRPNFAIPDLRGLYEE